MNTDFLIPHFPLSYPVDEVFLTQGFGQNGTSFYEKLGMKGHNGLDLRAPDGTPCYAAMPGLVIESGEDYQGGRLVKIRSEEKEVNGKRYRVEIIYYHLKTWEVKAGQFVNRGQLVATADNTGVYTTASHLHFGFKIYVFDNGWRHLDYNNGYFGAQDPTPFLTYMPEINNPYGFPNNQLIKLNEGHGGFGYFSEEDGGRLYVDNEAKIIGSWMDLNNGDIKGKITRVPLVAWNSYDHYNLKRELIRPKGQD